jgi:hypothetical protein
MSLIKRIQACGLCYCECQSITFKEAEAIKELVLKECIVAVLEIKGSGRFESDITTDQAVDAIQEIE